MRNDLIDFVGINCWVSEWSWTFALADYSCEGQFSFGRVQKLVFDDAFISRSGWSIVCFSGAKWSFDGHGAWFCITGSDFEVKSSSFLDVNNVTIIQLFSQLLLGLKLFIKEFFVVVSVGNIRLRRVALIDSEGKISHCGNRNDNVHVLMWVDFEGKFVLQRKVNYLSGVDTDW